MKIRGMHTMCWYRNDWNYHPRLPMKRLQHDYRMFLKENGYTDDDLVGTQTGRRFLIPFFREFVLVNQQGMEQNVAELAEYARAFSLQKNGKPVLITSNLFHGLPRYTALRKYCDLIIGEKSDIQLRQDGFYRFGQAFLSGKPGCFIEDPNEYVLQIIQDSDQARNDSYILFMLEPLAHGFQIAIPYGAWLMNLKKDSFYPNLEVERLTGYPLRLMKPWRRAAVFERELRNRGMGIIKRLEEKWTTIPGVREDTSLNGDETIITQHTPVGSVSTRWKVHAGRVSDHGDVQVEWPIKGPGDFDPVLYIIQNSQCHQNYDEITSPGCMSRYGNRKRDAAPLSSIRLPNTSTSAA